MNNLDEQKICYSLYVTPSLRMFIKKESAKRNLRENEFVKEAVEAYSEEHKIK